MTINGIKIKTSILISMCCECNAYMGFKEGHGTTGISHGFCAICMNTVRKKVVKYVADNSKR